MPLTKEKYDDKNKTYFVSDAEKTVLIEKLGHLERLIEKYEVIADTDIELYENIERLFAVGNDGVARIERAIGSKVYVLSGKKLKKAYLLGFADGNTNLITIARKGEQTDIPYGQIYLSKREGKCERRRRQRYELNKEQFDSLFPGVPFIKNSYLMEEQPYSNVFKVYTKVFRYYYRPLSKRSYTLEELKEKFYFDIDDIYRKEKEKFLNKLNKKKTG